MTREQRTEPLTRDGLLRRLSAVEAASVTSAETAGRVCDGDAYLDLKRLSDGVIHARGAAMPMVRVLAKKALHEDTWRKILAQLGAG